VTDVTRIAIPATLAALPFAVADVFDSPRLVGVSRAGGIAYTSAAALRDRAGALGLGLAAMGVRPGDRVAIISESRPEWLEADLAILMRGAVSVPVYPTVSAPQVEAILADSGAMVAVVSNVAQAEKVIAAAPRLPALTAIVYVDPPAAWPDTPVPQQAAAAMIAVQTAAWADPAGQAAARAVVEAVTPDDLATIIYTSGSSGEPKGVMLTHANIVANLRDVPEVLTLGPEDTAVSFLPLSHAFERTTAYVYLTHGVSLVFAESIDTLARDLMAVRPTVMIGVPRVFEKLLDRIVEAGHAEHGIKRRVFDLAMAVARERGRTVPSGARPAWWAILAHPLVDGMVYRRVRERLGGRLRFAVSGSAPLREDVGRLFFGLGMGIVEGYGLTERRRC
jgi:long-chain acyl-CoA synthetase